MGINSFYINNNGDKYFQNIYVLCNNVLMQLVYIYRFYMSLFICNAFAIYFQYTCNIFLLIEKTNYLFFNG